VKEQANHFPWQLCCVAVAGCIGLSVAAYMLGISPLLQQREHDTAQQQLLADRRATASQVSSAVANVQRDLAAAKQALANTPVRLQPATLVNQRLEAVARVATECGVALDEMRPGSAADSTHFQTVPIRIVGSGRYPACATFLRTLRATFGDMGVRTFQAANSAAASATPSALFQAELVWFTELPRK
jgi:Tfp pilus assembly protein PilO